MKSTSEQIIAPCKYISEQLNYIIFGAQLKFQSQKIKISAHSV